MRSSPRGPFPAREGILALVLFLLSGCGESRSPAPGEAETVRAELGLDAGTPVETVLLGGGRGEVHLVPDSLAVPRGAVVAFRTTDGRPHAVLFELSEMEPGPRQFLLETRQEASPPLVDLGQRFLLDLREAPVGRYPYRDEAGAEGACGVVRVF